MDKNNSKGLVKQISLLPRNNYNLHFIELVDIYDQFKDYYRKCEIDHKKYWLENAKKEWVVLDVGANIGIFSVLLSKLCKKVYSFEPISETIKKLKKNLKHNNCENVEIVEKAVSNKSGEYKDKIHSLWEYEVQDKEFNFITLDEWVEKNNIKVDAVKIDVDGYDYEVLLGGENFLKNQKPKVIVEINHALKTRNYNEDQAKSYMGKIGYNKMTRLDEDNYLFEWL